MEGTLAGDRSTEMREVQYAAGSEGTAVVANGVEEPRAVFFAAASPKRASALVLHGCFFGMSGRSEEEWGRWDNLPVRQPS